MGKLSEAWSHWLDAGMFNRVGTGSEFLLEWERDHPASGATREELDGAIRELVKHLGKLEQIGECCTDAFYRALGQEPQEDAAPQIRYIPPTVQELAERDVRIAELEHQVKWMEHQRTLDSKLVCSLVAQRDDALQRAEKAEAEVERLKQCCQPMAGMSEKPVTPDLVDGIAEAAMDGWIGTTYKSLGIQAARAYYEEHKGPQFEVGQRVEIAHGDGTVLEVSEGLAMMVRVIPADVKGTVTSSWVRTDDLYSIPPSPKRCGCGACVCSDGIWFYQHEATGFKFCPQCGERLVTPS